MMSREVSGGPPEPPPPLKEELDRIVDSARSGAPVLGEPLLLLGSGPIPVRGSVGAAVGLASDGAVVLLVALPSVEGAAASDVADQVDRIGQMSEDDLEQLQTDPADGDPRERHAEMFPEAGSPPFNRSQRVKLLVATRPTEAAWKAALIEVGRELQSVHLVTASGPEEIEPPSELRGREGPPTAWSPWQWAGLAGMLLGVALASVALWRALDRPAPVIRTVQVRSVVQDVAVDVPGDATNANWIGQSRLFKTSGGRLLAVSPGSAGVQVVSDHRNHGRTWRSPLIVPGLRADALSAAIDGADRLHLASIDGSQIRYTLLEGTETGWRVAADLPVSDSGNTVVDIAWDEDDRRAHVVWAEVSGDSQEPRWANISVTGDEAVIAQEEGLADAGEDIPVLANVAASAGSVTATYRRGDSPSGWYSRTATGSEGTYTWGPEERLPTDSPIGAAALVRSGRAAHLILRDNAQNSLVYLRRRDRSGWFSPQTALEATRIEEIDFPALSVDASSGLLYVFFQSDALQPSPQIQMAVRDPLAGWEGPFQTADPQSVPDGAAYPVTLGVTVGEPLVLWTRGGGVPTIQAARVSAP